MTADADTSHQSRLWIAIVLLGLALRSYHYFRQPSIWHDEAALIVNVLTRDYEQLLGPLLWHEASPPLFLWLERAVGQHLSDGVRTLRLPSFLASCLALLLMPSVTRSLLTPRARPWALLLFACSDQLCWHACEAKSYSFDVLGAVVLLAVYCRTRDNLARMLLLYALLAPVLIFLSYPACFLYGGVLLAFLPAAWRCGWEMRLRYTALAVLVCGSFALLALGPARAQRDGAILTCWLDFFPHWDRPWTVPGWLVTSSLGVLRYACKPIGETLVVFALVGGWCLYREGRRELLVLLTVPLALTLAAACLWRYPFGGARVTIYAAPALVVLIAAGAIPMLAWMRSRCRPGAVLLTGLLLMPLTAVGNSVLRPWERPDTASAARWVEDCWGQEDAVLGNDWTHHYYFRRLHPHFADLRPLTEISAKRVWIVYTADVPKQRRERELELWIPQGWSVVCRREFDLTTVLLLQRREENRLTMR